MHTNPMQGLLPNPNFNNRGVQKLRITSRNPPQGSPPHVRSKMCLQPIEFEAWRRHFFLESKSENPLGHNMIFKNMDSKIQSESPKRVHKDGCNMIFKHMDSKT